MKKSKSKLVFLSSLVVISLAIFGILLLGELLKKDKKNDSTPTKATNAIEEKVEPDPYLSSAEIEQNFLTVNEYSRPGTKIDKVTAVVVHYVGNAGTTAAQNRSYFEGLATNHNTYASSHYIIGLEGEIIQCVPLEEISYASNDRNHDTIAIECCHPDKTGKFTNETYNSLVKLTAALCRTYNLEPETQIIRHYDVTGKLCPLYYANNESEWRLFKIAVRNEM